jgi:hypothetical protein
MNEKVRLFPRLLLLTAILFVSILLYPSIAFAYVDPGSGSVIVTTILGLIAAIGYTFRKYFYKLKNLILGKKTPEDQDGGE